MKKVVLITGTTSSIGLAAARLFHENGYRVFGTSRRPLDTQDEVFETLSLEMHSEASVRSCVAQVLENVGRIDVLVNNVGVADGVGPLEDMSADRGQKLFQTNFFGAARMIQAVLPHMRRQRSGRIINVGSIAGSTTSPGLGMYAASKSALAGYTATLRTEVSSFGIHVSLLIPGAIRGWESPGGDANRCNSDGYVGFRDRVLSCYQAASKNGLEPMQLARLIVRVAGKRNPASRYVIGADARMALLSRSILPSRIFDWVIQKYFRLPKRSVPPAKTRGKLGTMKGAKIPLSIEAKSQS